MGRLPIDDIPSTLWAIACVSAKGALGLTAWKFDLVNNHTQRAHRLFVRAGGIDAGFPIVFSPESSMSNYGYFQSSKPLTFDDFDGVGARVISTSALIWSWTSLTLWEGPAYVSKGLAAVRMSGWGVSTPGANLDNGWTSVEFGDGQPMGIPETVLDIEIPIQELIELDVHLTSNEERVVFVLPDSVLFNFNESTLKPGAESVVEKIATLVKAIPKRRKVYVNGYTDGIGTDAKNLILSQDRAQTVASWLTIKGKFQANQLEVDGFGKSPVLL